MKMKKLLCLALIAVFVLSALCACHEEPEQPHPVVIMTSADGKSYTSEVFSYYAHYMRDTIKNTFNNTNYYYMFNGSFETYLNYYYDADQTTTIYQYILDSVKDQFSRYWLIEEQFAKLGLKFDEETQKQADAYRDSFFASVSEEDLTNLCDTLMMTKDDLTDLVVNHQFKQVMLTEYYVGEGGENEITDEDVSNYYDEHYLRFRYAVLSKYDESTNQKLGDSDLALLATQTNDIIAGLNAGGSFDKVIRTKSDMYLTEDDIDARVLAYANAYKETYKKDATEDELKTYRQGLVDTNEAMLTQGMICDLAGIYDLTYYNTYGSAVDSAIVTKLKTMSLGDYAKVETDAYIWIIEKCDIHSDDSYLASKHADILTTMSSTRMDEYYLFWANQAKFTFIDENVMKFDPRTLEDLFFSKTTK